jgi:hypothetical protein
MPRRPGAGLPGPETPFRCNLGRTDLISAEWQDHLNKEQPMIEITESAREMLLESLKGQEANPAVRVYVAGSG